MVAADFVRDALEILIVIAIGGILWSVIGKLRRGEISVVRCEACDRPTSRAYPNCKHCGTPRSEPPG
ncbi:MAG TPA: hypothetical protein VD926_02505 [Acidimicrobiales bacterium]|nr:hypothetical protein [Acidimicrobiales bacterium]